MKNNRRKGIFKIYSDQEFRQPMAVYEKKRFSNGDVYSLCPRCKSTMDRDYQRFCDRCGQALDWPTSCQKNKQRQQ